MKFIDLFAGVGGFRLGMERSGHQCVWSCEIDRWCNYVYRKQFGEGFDWKDARTVNPRTIPDHDILCAGFPCQPFSYAGKRQGFLDTRGTLFDEILRIADAKRSPYLFLENVPGLLSHSKGRTFATVLYSLSELGYSIQWQCINSKNYVPQNRERVFVIGHLGKGSSPEVFPFPQDGQMPYEAQRRTGSKRQKIQNEHNKTIAHAIQFRYYKDGSDQLISDGLITRRLTPIECERLQGFPDNFTVIGIKDGKEIPISDTQRYKMMGNAVTVPVIEAIARRAWG